MIVFLVVLALFVAFLLACFPVPAWLRRIVEMVLAVVIAGFVGLVLIALVIWAWRTVVG